MIEAFDRERRSCYSSRLIAIPQKNLEALLVERGIPLDDLDDVKAAVVSVGAVISAHDAVRYPFTRTVIYPQRYNTSDFAAFYTALGHDTCLAEIKYHLGKTIAADEHRFFRFLEIKFDGVTLNLDGHQERHPDLVSPTEAGYPFCQSVAIEARLNALDALYAPSARYAGICIPIFVEGSISEPALSETVRFMKVGGEVNHETVE